MIERRYHKSGLSHKSQQAKRLKRYCLASRIRSGYYQQVIIPAESYIYRHHLIFINKRMSCFLKVYDTLFVILGSACIHIKSKPSPCEYMIKPGKDILVRPYLIRMFRT